jgi:hypothetical protein
MQTGKRFLNSILTLFFLVITFSLHAQSDNNFIKEIDFSKDKKFVENFVVERMKAYYIHNTDNSWKTIRKIRGINLKKESKRTAFLNELETDIRTQFQQVSELSHVNLYTKYKVFISEIIGRYSKARGLSPYNGITGSGDFNIGFTKEKIQFISFTLRTTTAYSKFSGVEYLAKVIEDFRKDFKTVYPDYKETSYKGSTNVCTDKGEPQYNIAFSTDIPDRWKFHISYEFGPMVRQNNSYSCTYLGNHLTSIYLFWWNNKVKP